MLLITHCKAIDQTGFQDVKQDEINCGHLNPVESPCQPFHRAKQWYLKKWYKSQIKQ